MKRGDRRLDAAGCNRSCVFGPLRSFAAEYGNESASEQLRRDCVVAMGAKRVYQRLHRARHSSVSAA